MTFTAIAPAPQRATDSILLAWGLVTIPLSIYAGTETTNVERKEFLVTEDPQQLISVGRSPVRKDTGAVVDNSQVIRKAESSNGDWVPLSDAEIAECTTPKGLAEIETYIPIKHFGRYLSKDVKQVRPKPINGKINPNTERAFALFLDTLKRLRVGALVKVALRGPAKYALITSDGDLVFLHTADALREARPINRDVKSTPRERELATSLVQQVGISDVPPVLVDDTAALVQKFVNAKAAGIAKPVVTVSPDTAVSDLMASLEASVAVIKEEQKFVGGASTVS